MDACRSRKSLNVVLDFGRKLLCRHRAVCAYDFREIFNPVLPAFRIERFDKAVGKEYDNISILYCQL